MKMTSEKANVFVHKLSHDIEDSVTEAVWKTETIRDNL